MTPLYNIAISLYAGAARLASLKSEKVKKMTSGHKESEAKVREAIKADDKKVMWVHAASLGEFEQGRPLIERLREEHPEYKIVVTFFSPSGYEVRKNYDKADAVVYLPFDTPKNAKRMIDVINPSIAVFVKYEFWGNYLSELKRREIPTYLISGIFREGQAFFKPWGGEFRKMLDCFDHLYVQDEPSRKLLEGIGVNNVTVAGDTRFDRVTQIMAQTVDMPEIEAVKRSGSGKFIVAGSTWQPDEALLLKLLDERKDVKMVIAPHVLEGNHVEEIIKKTGRKCTRLSELTVDNAADTDCVIVDCYGKLASIYRYGDIAYVGGGFGVGIHNINEAAVYGMPVVFGPKYQKFKEARDLVERGGAFSISDDQEFDRVMQRLLNDDQALKSAGAMAGAYIKENIGATDIIWRDIWRK